MQQNQTLGRQELHLVDDGVLQRKQGPSSKVNGDRDSDLLFESSISYWINMIIGNRLIFIVKWHWYNIIYWVYKVTYPVRPPYFKTLRDQLALEKLCRACNILYKYDIPRLITGKMSFTLQINLFCPISIKTNCWFQ